MSKVGKAKLVYALLCCALLLGCRSHDADGETTISRERFIDAQVALRQVDRAKPEADSLRAEVMTTLGITEEDLTSFVDERSDRPAELASVYEEIRQRLREVREEQRQPRRAEQGTDSGDEDAGEAEVESDREAQRPRIRAPAPPPAQRI